MNIMSINGEELLNQVNIIQKILIPNILLNYINDLLTV